MWALTVKCLLYYYQYKMYCTISEAGTPPGTLPLDARLSHETLVQNAELLGSLSASFSREARDASLAYRDALTTPTPDAWTRFVIAADSLARHTESIETVVSLSSPERKACEYFKQIAGENADLLTLQVAAAA
jgi:hypothetical protein